MGVSLIEESEFGVAGAHLYTSRSLAVGVIELGIALFSHIARNLSSAHQEGETQVRPTPQAHITTIKRSTSL